MEYRRQAKKVPLLFLKIGVDFICEHLDFIMLSFITGEASCKDIVFNHVHISCRKRVLMCKFMTWSFRGECYFLLATQILKERGPEPLT